MWEGFRVHPVILWTVVAAGLAVAVVGGVCSALGRIAGRNVLVVLAVAELTTLVESIVAGTEALRGHHLNSSPTFAGYVIGNVLVLPIAVIWAWSERTRWSGAVVAVGGLTIAVMTARLQMMWQGGA